MKLDEATRKWIKRHQRQYDEELEAAGLMTGRKAVAIMSALPPGMQRKFIGAVIAPKRKGGNHAVIENENATDSAPETHG